MNLTIPNSPWWGTLLPAALLLLEASLVLCFGLPPHLQITYFQGVLNSGEEGKVVGPCLGSMGADTPVECSAWLKTTAQVWLCMAMRYDEFAMHHTTIFWVIYSELNCREFLLLLNKNHGLQFGLVKHSDCEQCILDQKKW